MKVRRRLVAAITVMCGVIGLAVAASPAVGAATGPIFTVMNTSETLPDGVWFRNSPHTADTSRITGLGVYKNEQVQLQCYAWGDAVGPYNDQLWYYVNNVTRPAVAGRANVGYLNAHYINDGKNANQVDAGVPACGAPPPSPTIINGVNVGYPQNSPHAWGAGCIVQDFNGGPSGWVIVGYSNGTNIVRNGMLWGWFDNGGGPGLGCPVNQEHGYSDGVRQDFTHGSLYWMTGMNHASRIDWTDTQDGTWSGYVASAKAITSVHSSWTVPAVHCGAVGGKSYFAIWAGIDGTVRPGDLVQAGSGAECDSATSSPIYSVWTEVIPKNVQTSENVLSRNVKPGDAISVDISYGLNNRYTIVVTLRGVSFRPVTGNTAGSHATAECIAESPTVNNQLSILASFDPVSFTTCQMTRLTSGLFPIAAAPTNGGTLARYDMQFNGHPLRATPGLPRGPNGPWAIYYRASNFR